MEKISAYSSMVNMQKLSMFNPLGLVPSARNDKTVKVSNPAMVERRGRNGRRASDKKDE